MNRIPMCIPKTRIELIDILEKANSVDILAGGTDLIIKMKKRGYGPNLLADITHIEDLKGVTKRGNEIHIGTLTTFTELGKNEVVKKFLTPLYEASRRVGSVQIRNRATIGGNIVNRAPAADGVNALVVLNADVVLNGAFGKTRRLPLEVFLKEGIEAGEVLMKIIVNAMATGYQGAFSKVGTRTAVTISQVILSGIAKVEEGRVADLRLSLGAVGPQSFVPYEVCEWSKGKKVDANFRSQLEEKLSQAVEKAIPERSSMPYKRVAVRGLLDDIYERLFIDED